LLAEHAPAGRRGFVTSWTQSAALLGFVAGAGLATLLAYVLSPQDLVAWGWRLPFLLAGPLGAVGLYLRLRLADAPAFAALRRTGATARSPLAEALTHNRWAVLLAAALVAAPNVGFYLLLTYTPVYLTREGRLPAAAASATTTAALILVVALLPVFGALSDRLGRKPLLLASCLGMALLSYPAFLLMSRGGVLAAALAQAALAALLAAFIGPVAAALAELFPTRVRYTGFSLSQTLSGAVFGGTAPLVATWLIAATSDQLAPALWLMAAGLLTLAAVGAIGETAGAPLRAA
jgi:MHS family proline/betaine transporter-like MFS transporter